MFKLKRDGLSEDEQKNCSHIESTLGSLQSYVDDFYAALQLYTAVNFNSNSPQPWPYKWSFVAGRDGAMSLYHFYTTLAALRANLHIVPTLMPNINHALLKSVDKEFRKSFPFTHLLRHSVAHASELTKDKASTEKNVIKGADHHPVPGIFMAAGSSMTIRNSFFGDEFANTIEGQLVKYSLGPTTMNALSRYLETVREALANVLEPVEPAR